MIRNEPPLPSIPISILSPETPLTGHLIEVPSRTDLPDGFNLDPAAYMVDTIRESAPPFLRVALLALQLGTEPPPEIQDEYWSTTYSFRHFLLAVDAALVTLDSEYLGAHWLINMEQKCVSGQVSRDVRHCLQHYILPVLRTFSAARALPNGCSKEVVDNFESATIPLSRFIV